MALAPVDETGEDLENLDFTTCKDRIVSLQADRERRLEATERLQEKLKALNNELAARRLEADQRRLELKEEQTRNKQKAQEVRDRGEVDHSEGRTEEDQTKVRNFIEEMIQEKADGPQKKEKQRSKFGFRVFDETELMVEKALEAPGKDLPIDTVLVTHQKPNSDDVRYHLSYRVAKDTPSKKLREDACNYWNLSEVEYILLTVENSKVHDEVPLQHCFKPNERCQLILAPKDPRRQILMDKELLATRPVLGKGAKNAKKVDKGSAEDSSKKYNSAQNFLDWLQAKQGMWDFMVQRDRNVVDHLTRIKLRSIVIYFLFIACCFVVYYFVKPPGAGYYFRQGPLKAMTDARLDLDSMEMVPAYDDIKTQEEAWRWLTYTVSSQLLVADSDLRHHNYLIGWLRVRMQQVAESAPSACRPSALAGGDVYCVDQNYDETKAGTEDLEFVRLYWDGYNATTTTTSTTVTTTFQGQGGGRRLIRQNLARTPRETPDVALEEDSLDSYQRDAASNFFDADEAEADRDAERAEYQDSAAEARRLLYGMADWTNNYPYTSDIPTVKGTDGRSASVSPWKFMDSTANIASHAEQVLSGSWGRYAPSGYNLDYHLQHDNMTAMYLAYRSDMVALRERGWFTNRTRSIIVSFTLYSSNFDLWMQNDYVLEMPANAIVNPNKHIDVFSPSLKDSAHGWVVFWLDNIRMLCALYILIAQVYYEISVAKAREEKWLYTYLLTPVGLADVAIGGITIWIYVVRQVTLGLVEEQDVFLKNLVNHEFGFQSTNAAATLYRQHLQLEAPLMCLLLFRFFSLLRINRQVFIIWTTLVEAAKLYVPFCLVLAPVGFGLVIWAHGLWHSTQKQYTSLPLAAMSVIMMIHGDVKVVEVFESHRPDTLIFGFVLYVVTWLLLVNAWIAVLVHVYQNVRVRAGFRPADYKWQEKHYVQWALWTPVAGFYFQYLRPRIEKPKSFQVADDDDDDK